MIGRAGSGKLVFSIQHFPPFLGGAECQACLLATELSRTHGDTLVVTTRFDRALLKREVKGRVNIRRLPTVGSPAARLIVNFFSSLLYNICRGHAYGIVHCHCLSSYNLAAVIAGKVHRYRTVVKICSIGPDGDIQKIRRLPLGNLIWRFYRSADMFIAPSNQVARELIKEGAVESKIKVIPNALPEHYSDVDEFDKVAGRRALGLPEKPTILYVGRLSPDKNIMALQRAWAALADRRRASLVIVGEGPEMPSILQWRSSLDHPESVFLTGYVDDPYPYYRAADIFVFPSTSETFGNAIVEAMSQGLAVLTTPVGVVGDYDDIRSSVELFDSCDDDALFSKLEWLISNPEDRRRLGDLARKATLERFKVDRIAARYSELYEYLQR